MLCCLFSPISHVQRTWRLIQVICFSTVFLSLIFTFQPCIFRTFWTRWGRSYQNWKRNSLMVTDCLINLMHILLCSMWQGVKQVPQSTGRKSLRLRGLLYLCHQRISIKPFKPLLRSYHSKDTTKHNITDMLFVCPQPSERSWASRTLCRRISPPCKLHLLPDNWDRSTSDRTIL